MLLLLIISSCASLILCVEELTASDFEDVLKKHKNVLVEFYTPWCTTCDAFEPMYNNVELEFLGEKDILIARIDADEAEALAKKYDVEHFPTIWLFTNGSKEGIEYIGDLDEESIIDFVITEADGNDEVGSGHKDDFLDDDDDDDDDDNDDYDNDESDADWKKMQDDIDHMNDILSGSAGKRKNITTTDSAGGSYRSGYKSVDNTDVL